MCVCVSLSLLLSVCVAAGEEIDIPWHHEFEWVDQLFSRMTTMIRILRDLKPIPDLDLYSEHMPEERITGSKTCRVDLYMNIYGILNSATLF